MMQRGKNVTANFFVFVSVFIIMGSFPLRYFINESNLCYASLLRSFNEMTGKTTATCVCFSYFQAISQI